jgi:Flp pilus assembly protein TadG
MSHRIKQFLHAQDGVIAAMTAVSLVVILGFGAFAIDMSYAYSERNLLQVTADAAALAAAPELPSDQKVWEMALEYVEDNMPAATHGKVQDRTDVFVGNWNPVTETWLPGVGPLNAVKVTIRPSSANLLARILGLLGMEASAFAYIEAPTGRTFVIVSAAGWRVQQ